MEGARRDVMAWRRQRRDQRSLGKRQAGDGAMVEPRFDAEAGTPEAHRVLHGQNRLSWNLVTRAHEPGLRDIGTPRTHA
jgi:hypothetical protein